MFEVLREREDFGQPLAFALVHFLRVHPGQVGGNRSVEAIEDMVQQLGLRDALPVSAVETVKGTVQHLRQHVRHPERLSATAGPSPLGWSR